MLMKILESIMRNNEKKERKEGEGYVPTCYVGQRRIKEADSLTGLLQECETDFDVVNTFSTTPYGVLNRYFDEEHCLKNEVPMLIYEHAVGIPLKPKSFSSFGKPTHPEYGGFIEYYIAPTERMRYCQGGLDSPQQNNPKWALYECMFKPVPQNRGERK